MVNVLECYLFLSSILENQNYKKRNSLRFTDHLLLPFFIKMHQYDYIITGSGASGLMLAYRMSKDPFFNELSILIIDKAKKDVNDKTWCFWENNIGEWDDLVYKSWNTIQFKSDFFKKEILLDSYSYKMIRSVDFYKKLQNVLHSKKNITIIEDKVEEIKDEETFVCVNTSTNQYKANKVFNSIDFKKSFENQTEYPVLLQHFKGWFIETDIDVFNASIATLMDFTVQQKQNTRFMYVLPLTPRKALFEYTLFSKNTLSNDEYESEISAYINNKGIKNYKIYEKEKGIIPMTSYKFWNHNSKNILHIGTVGGWTKASTGYTFRNTTKKTKQIINFLKKESDFRNFRKKTRFWWYDLLMIDVLTKDNHFGAKLFSKLFQRNSVSNVFKFLDDESNLIQEVRIILSIPPLKFIKAFLKRSFKI